MRFILYSTLSFEKWDWRNSVEGGIGGSETSHVEMVWRLARRGHEVITYAPIPDDCPGEWRGTQWYPVEAADFSKNGVWVIYRTPPTLDHFDLDHPGKTLWLVHQDWDYPTLKGDRLTKLDKMLLLCEWHRKYTLERHPELDGKIMVTSNGIKGDLIEQVEKESIPRNPKKILYASSPDRGLHCLLPIFERAREFDPELELHAFYGFNNMDKFPDAPQYYYFKKLKEKVLSYQNKPGIYLHGRINQVDLYRHWLSAGIWAYPTNFSETSCITCMEAQAMGAIPITNPIAALAENVHWGTFIPGDAYGDALSHARFAAEIVRWANADKQESIRSPMMADARKRFDWEVFVDQWEREAEVACAV